MSNYNSDEEFSSEFHSHSSSDSINRAYFASSSASPSPPMPCSNLPTSLHLFRLNSLRLHDNPALTASLSYPNTQFKGIFVLDPWFMSGSRKFGLNRWRFLIECLHDIKRQLNALNLQLYVARGLTAAVLSELCRKWDVVHLTYQMSCEPKSLVEEKAIDEACNSMGVNVEKFCTHSLFDLTSVIKLNEGNPVLTFKEFSSLFPKLGLPAAPLPSPPPKSHYYEDDTPFLIIQNYQIPTLEEVGYRSDQLSPNPWVGGETEALKRLPVYCETRKSKFEDPSDMLLDQTSLSPYIRFGCLSVRHLWYCLHKLSMEDQAYNTLRKEVVAKLLQREFYLIVSTQVPNFESINNSICLPLPWENDHEMLSKWKSGITGYPWIDAAMVQLHQEGWIHHHLRESIATFLTRGDLWLSWEHGRDLFEVLLLDFEPSVSCGCWMKSSGCSFITDSLEHFCPISFGMKIDPHGRYIRKYLPQLAEFPSEYIYSPWRAPRHLQEQLQCVIGVDYPFPIIDHLTAGSICIERLRHSVKYILDRTSSSLSP